MSEAKPTQLCPICGAGQPLSSRTCSICGALLPGELTPVAPMPQVDKRAKSGDSPLYDPALGDDDLFVGDLSGRMWRLMLVGGVSIALILGLAIGIGVSWSLRGDDDNSVSAQNGDANEQSDSVILETHVPTAPPTATPRNGIMLSPTPSPTSTPPPMMYPTVTPMPPTPTITPTPAPCMQTAWAGATIFEMALRCGHESWDVVDVILELNNMESAAELREGQTLEIPWPTPTPGPNPPTEPPDTGADAAGSEQSGLAVDTSDAMAGEVILNEFGTPDRLAEYENIEPTLRPGMAWHTIQAGETIIDIAYRYETRVEVLSQINPEIQFFQCDYGQTYGGPDCSVMLIEGEQLRVPVPVPTVTPTATPGTRTPTPTATMTYNAPYLVSPEDGVHFNADQIVTLRWGGTGTLAANERYVVRVYDRDTGAAFLALVMDTFYLLPGGWQPADGKRHTLEWTISIGMIDAEYNIIDEFDLTEPRSFSWDSR